MGYTIGKKPYVYTSTVAAFSLEAAITAFRACHINEHILKTIRPA